MAWVAKSGTMVRPKIEMAPGSGIEVMPLAPLVTVSASAVRRATSVRTRVTMAK